MESIFSSKVNDHMHIHITVEQNTKFIKKKKNNKTMA